MTLVAATVHVGFHKTGRLKVLSSNAYGAGPYTGILEPEPNWLVCNGATIPNSGKYVALFAMIASKFGGAGILPNFLDGRQPMPKGATNFPTVGATGGEFSHVLTLAEYPNHTHSSRDGLGGPRGNNLDGYINVDGWPNGTQAGGNLNKTSSAYGGGGAHPNMPPYQIGGFWLVRL